MNIREQLFALEDKKYKDFQSKLIPNISPDVVIGVRTPELRKLAKKIVKEGDYEDFLEDLPHQYYDEMNLHGFIISEIKDYELCVDRINAFLPYVDNWATCDLLSPKVFKKHLPETLENIKIWMASKETYTIRFGIEMLMSFYLDEHFKKEYLDMVAKVRSEEYYINMMVAWYFVTALAKQYDATFPYIKKQTMDTWTHNKAIQKAIESRRITDEQKDYLRTLKIKK